MKLQIPTNKGAPMNTKPLLKAILALALGTGLTGAAWAAPAVVEKGESSYTIVDSSHFWVCAGENVSGSTSASFTYHWMQMPNGKTLYLEMWIKEVTGMLVGETSGYIWHRVGNISPYIDHRNEDGTQRILQYTFKGAWVSENGGPTIEVREMYHISFDANGELRVERDELNCWETN